jgi:hypothetical protein
MNKKSTNDRIILQFENKHTLLISIILMPILIWIIHLVNWSLTFSDFGTSLLVIPILLIYSLIHSLIIKFYKPVSKQNYLANLTFSVQTFFAYFVAAILGLLLSAIIASLGFQLFNESASLFALIAFSALYWLFVLYPYAERKWGFSVPKFFIFMIISALLSFILLGIILFVLYLIFVILLMMIRFII